MTSPYVADPHAARPRWITCYEHGGSNYVERFAEIKHPDGSRRVYAFARCGYGGHEHGERIGCSQQALPQAAE